MEAVMDGVRVNCGRALSVVNGNFWKVLAGSLTIMIMVFQLYSYRQQNEIERSNQSNYARLEERIIALQDQVASASRINSGIQADMQMRHEKLRDLVSELNAEVKAYRMLPTQLVTNSKAIEQTRAQMNMVLYRVLGMQKKDCVGEEC